MATHLKIIFLPSRQIKSAQPQTHTNARVHLVITYLVMHIHTPLWQCSSPSPLPTAISDCVQEVGGRDGAGYSFNDRIIDRNLHTSSGYAI